MPDVSAILQLPYLQPSQAQKHVTHNEALRLLDVIVQIAVESATLATPPSTPTNGQRWIVGPAASGDWTGQTGRIAAWLDNAWMVVPPQDGWIAWDRATARALVYLGATNAWEPMVASGGGSSGPEFADTAFAIGDNADASRRLRFEVGTVPAATTRVLTAPAGDGVVATLANAAQTFLGAVTLANPVVSVGTATTTATYGLGTGATAAATTKSINIGTGGVSGSTTIVNIGSTVAGAGGQMVVNSPSVQFAASVATVAAPQAAVTAARLGLGGATPDVTNRLSVNAPATLLNHAGAGHEVTLNKATAGADAALAFKTGFSARALMGLLGSDDFTLKVSATGATYVDALLVDRATGRVELPEPLILPTLTAQPAAPPAGRLALYARTLAGQHHVEMARSSGRAVPLQAHLGFDRVASWGPYTGSTINAEGLPFTSVGTLSTPVLAATSLATSIRRFRVASAATADAAAEMRGSLLSCWRGNAADLGGFALVVRISLAVLQPTGMGFFGFLGSTAALAGTQTLAGLVNALGLGFQRGTHANWQLVHNDSAGAPTLTDLGPDFAVATGGLLTIHLAAAPNATTASARVVNDATGAVFETTASADLPAASQFRAPRLFLGSGPTAAAAAFETSGLYLETDY